MTAFADSNGGKPLSKKQITVLLLALGEREP
jgi:hypothetical protein